MSDRERSSIDPITAELCVWTCCFKNKIVNHLFPFILFSLTSTYMYNRNLSKERERKRNFTSLFNCDPQYSAYKTRYLLWWCLIWIILYIRCFCKSLLIVHCYKIVCIYFKLWSEIFFYTFLYLLKNYCFTYFRNVDLLKHFLRQ